MAAQSVPIDAALDAYGRTQFGIADIQRRAQGHAFGAFGLDPNECPYKVIASGPFWRLRDYTKHDTAPSLLIVAAPIKRPYSSSAGSACAVLSRFAGALPASSISNPNSGESRPDATAPAFQVEQS
jgi:hypothetical protein